VVEADQRTWTLAFEERARRGEAVLGLPGAADSTACHLDSGRAEDFADAGEPFHRGDRPGGHVAYPGTGSDQVDAFAVAGLEQQARGGAAGLDLVGQDAGKGRRLPGQRVE